MGNCFSSEDENSLLNPVPDFFYLFRDKKYLLRVSNSPISKFKFENSIKIRKDSGIGYLNDGRIIVAGGTDNSGCLTNKAYIINPSTCQILSITNLPIATKEGSFFHYKSFAYYIGAIKEAEDEDLLVQEQTAPIMKYYLIEGHWEIFNHKRNTNKLGFQDYLKKNMKSEEESDEEPEVAMQDVIYAGTFMLGTKIYFVNGQRMSSRGILKSMNLIFSIDLEEDDFNFKQELLTSPIKVFRPICGSYGDKAILTGGLNPQSKKCNMQTYLFMVNNNNELVCEQVHGLNVSLGDTYPIISNHKSFIAVAYPNVAIYDFSANYWHMFVFEENLVNRNFVQYSTPVLETAILASGQIIKREGQYSVKYKQLDKGIDSEDLESGMSLSEPERLDKKTLKLPEGLLIKSEFTEKSSGDNDKNLSDLGDSDDFSVEHKIEIPVIRKSISHESPSSSINLSDRSIVKHNKKRLAPMALPAKNAKLKPVFKFDSNPNSSDSEDFEINNKHIPGIKVQEIEKEPEELSDHSSDHFRVKNQEKKEDSESSDFEISGVDFEPAHQIIQKKKEDSIDSPESKNRNVMSSSSELGDFKKENEKKYKDFEKMSESSSDFDFSADFAHQVISPQKKRVKSESSESHFSLENSQDKANLHKLVEDSQDEYEKHKESYVAKQKSDKSEDDSNKIDLFAKNLEDFSRNQSGQSEDSQRILDNKKKTYAGPISVKDKLKLPKAKKESIIDDDFGFESPRVEYPKVSAQVSPRKSSPLKNKPIHMKKLKKNSELAESKKIEKSPDSDSGSEIEKVKKTKTFKKKS